MKNSTNVIVLGKQKMGNNPQLYHIRFRSQSFRAFVYASRNNIQNKKKLKVKLSLNVEQRL